MHIKGKVGYKTFSATEISRMDGIKKKFNKNENSQYKNRIKLLQKILDFQMLKKGLIGKIAIFIRDIVVKLLN